MPAPKKFKTEQIDTNVEIKKEEEISPVIQTKPVSFWSTLPYQDIFNGLTQFIQNVRVPKTQINNPLNNVQNINQNQISENKPTEEEIQKQKEEYQKNYEEFLKSDEKFSIVQKELNELYNKFDSLDKQQQKDFKEFMDNKNNPNIQVKKIETKINQFEGNLIHLSDNMDAINSKLEALLSSLNKQDDKNKKGNN